MKFLSASLAFVFASVLAGIGLAFALGGLSVTAAVFALLAGLVVACFAWRQTDPDPAPPLRSWDWIILGIFVLASLRAFLWVVYLSGDELRVLSPNNLGDMSLHLNFIRNFASRVPFWPESPILEGVPLSYPLGADLFNSLLELCRIDTLKGLVWVGLFGAALTGMALWRWGGAFGVAALLFNGGLVGFAIFRTLAIEDFQKELAWKNLFLSMFVTQRGLLFALPAGLLLLYTWRNRYFRGGKNILPFWLQILLYASIPVFNLHAFLFLSAILAAIFLVRRDQWPDLIRLGAGAFIPATLLVALATGYFATQGAARFDPWWLLGEAATQETGWALWSFWAKSLVMGFGLSIPLLLIVGVILVRDRDQEARTIVWTSLAIFLFACLFPLTVWGWDNMKLLIWCWLAAAPYIWSKIIAPQQWAARAALCVALFFSGAVSLYGGLDARHGYAIGKRSELAAWSRATSDIPFEDRFACVPDYNHPLILLGRRVVCGYEGHLHSHGLDYREKLDALNASLKGESSWVWTVPITGADWLAVRTSDLPAVNPPGEAPAPESFGALYDLRPLLKQDPGNPGHQPLPRQTVD